MTENIIPFGNNDENLPAYLKNVNAGNSNKDLFAHDTSSFPYISIRGRQFRIVRGGEEVTITNPLDPKSPASYITVALIKVPIYTSKSYYEGNFDANSPAPQKPICWSNTGILPDQSVVSPCSVSCRICPKNQFGSAINMDGTPSKGKACRDSIKIAIAAIDNIQDPMLLRVPPTSIKGVVQLGRALEARGVPYNAAAVEISFDPDSPAQKLLFRVAGYLAQEKFKEVTEMSESELIKQITGLTDDVLSYAGEIQADAPAPTPTPAVEKAVATGRITPEAVKQIDVQAPIKKEKAKEEIVPEIISSKEIKGLDNLKFDD